MVTPATPSRATTRVTASAISCRRASWSTILGIAPPEARNGRVRGHGVRVRRTPRLRRLGAGHRLAAGGRDTDGRDVNDRGGTMARAVAPVPVEAEPFRFFDNREKYLLFVTTTSEKSVIAARVGSELDQLRPVPPALRVFDAGTGNGVVLSHVLRDLHRRMPTVPFTVVGKEVSMEDTRLTLGTLPDRLAEHPETVVALT